MHSIGFLGLGFSVEAVEGLYMESSEGARKLNQRLAA